MEEYYQDLHKLYRSYGNEVSHTFGDDEFFEDMKRLYVASVEGTEGSDLQPPAPTQSSPSLPTDLPPRPGFFSPRTPGDSFKRERKMPVIGADKRERGSRDYTNNTDAEPSPDSPLRSASSDSAFTCPRKR